MTVPAWVPDELAHAGPEHLDPAYVATYERKAGFDPAADIAILRELGLDETSTVVDLGAGTGAFALAVATLCRRVVAVDVSPAMVDVISDKVRQLDLDNVEVVQSGFLGYEHRGEPAAFVYSRNALHHLPDVWKAIALRRIAAILAPGGVLRLHDLVYSFAPDEAERVFEAWFAGAATDPALGWTRAELETHVREEHSTFSWLLEPMLERAGFELRAIQHAPSRTYSACTCVRLR